MIRGYITGEREIIASFDRRSEALGAELEKAIKRLTIQLQTKVKTEKLSGQVLGVRTGRGRRSIHAETFRAGDRVVGVVSTNVFYMAGWELGWGGGSAKKSIANAKAQFSPKVATSSFSASSSRKRSFLTPTLSEMESAGTIREEIEAAAERAMK